MLTIKTHLKSLVTSSLYLSNVGTLVLRSIFFRSRPPLLREGGEYALPSYPRLKRHWADHRNRHTGGPSTLQRLPEETS